jgi:hypothetical protein
VLVALPQCELIDHHCAEREPLRPGQPSGRNRSMRVEDDLELLAHVLDRPRAQLVEDSARGNHLMPLLSPGHSEGRVVVVLVTQQRAHFRQ